MKAVAIGLGMVVAAWGGVASAEVRTALDDARACARLPDGGHAVATGGGLAIVRAGKVQSLTSLDGLPETRVHAVVATSDGVWVGTEAGAALVSLDPPKVVRKVLDRPVHAISATSGGPIWIGTWGGGVVRLSDRTASPVPVRSTGTGKNVSAITDHDGVLDVAHADGPVTRLMDGVLAALATPSHGQALAWVGNRLVYGDLEGLFRIEGGHAVNLASVDVRGISGDLVGTYGAGLLRGASLRAEPGLPRWVRGVGEGCAATTEGLYLEAGGWHRVALGGPPSNDVTTLAVSGDRVVVGTFDHGAAIYRGSDLTPIRGLEPDETVNTAAWQGERLWLGTARGLVRVDGGAVTRRLRAADGLPSSIVRALLVLGPDRLLVGTEEGTATLEGERLVPLAETRKGGRQPLDSPMHATWALAKDDAGALWIGTSSGLYVGSKGGWKRIALATGGLVDDWVTALVVVGAGHAFVGTYSGGVTHIAGGTSRHLGGGYVNPDGLTVVGGDVYAATMEGLLARPAADDAATWRARPQASTGRDVTAVRAVGDQLWVGSRRGIAITRR